MALTHKSLNGVMWTLAARYAVWFLGRRSVNARTHQKNPPKPDALEMAG